MYHPWQRFNAEAQWTLQTAHLPRGHMGQIDWQTHTVIIDRNLLQSERRCTITHELVHIERGPVPSDPWLKQREEQAVEAEAARRLITLEALADALAWSSQPAEVAEELWVDMQTLDVRISGLSDTERTWLDRRLEIDQ
ncbi:ImmA/IrrE family metallo-endopeptidase [Propionibacterium ruminifibrarum]|uniref:ImmA/IrrE family metallo-endopeptidase n=1 Tax=Propionibacterium ruminifibrarum TaxID=1962131 RepID=UPI000E6B3E26|nr:ImmA/IrrE family metallo-endopeptidase [Propionibacterium ruminifibrarum]